MAAPHPATPAPGTTTVPLAPQASTPEHLAPSDAPPGAPVTREPGAYVPTLALTNVGIYLALLTPVMVTMAFKVRGIVGEGREASVLGVVLGLGALFAMLCNPLAGRLSDRTTSSFGMRRPWIVGGALVGVLALWIVATATTVPVLVLGWCLAQASLNAALAATNATLPDQVPVSRRGLASGLVGFGIPLAILSGSLLAGTFTSDLLRFVVSGLVALATALLFALFLKDRRLVHRPAERFGLKEFAGSFVIVGFGTGSFLSVDLALATQVLPDPDDTAKDLGVLNIANALPQSLAPLVAIPVLAVGALTPVGDYSFLFLFGALVAAAGAVLIYRVKGVR